MGRLGDLLRTERLRQKMTLKQVARKCGISEGYLEAVENGTRIIADDQARRILRTIGIRQQTEADFTLDDIAATVDLAQVRATPVKPVVKKEEPVRVASTEDEKGVAGSVWLDALGSVLKRVPVMNAVMKPVDHKLIPVENNRIEGANPDKVFYFLAPDDAMRGFRIHKGDWVFVVPAQSPVDGAVMLVEYDSHRALRKIKKLDDFRVMLQSYDREYDAQTYALNEVTFLGRATKVEFALE